MKPQNYLFTSESVTEGHPDKVADQISDAVLDAILDKDPNGRVACETLVTTGLVFVAGEITTSCYVDIPKIARKTVHRIGYDDPAFGFDSGACAVITSIQGQSPDIALGVDTGGAGDQGMMFGYATNETPEFMPLPISLAHKITRRVADLRKNKTVRYLRPDGKSQVTIEYRHGRPARVDTVVVSVHHDREAKLKEITNDMKRLVIEKVIPSHYLDKKTKIYVNPTGRFEVGGPQADTGLTGRKIIADTYGGYGAHGGGAFSGKDPTKVDRSASYMARYIAKNVVAAKLADKCEVQIAYAIGIAQPVSVMVNTHNTGKISNEELSRLVPKHFDLTPAGIIRDLKLRRPIYSRTATYGHFGREGEGFSWEELDKVPALRKWIA